MGNPNFDYSKTYYKVTNLKECHHGYQYKDGLNILKDRFDEYSPHHYGRGGGSHFTDYENLPAFFAMDTWIREIKIPENARVVKDGNRWRTDKIILGKKYHIVNDFEKWFDKDKFNWIHSYTLAEYCHGKFDTWFNKDKFNWNFSYALAEYCHDKFDLWFDKDKFGWSVSFALAEYCHNKFDVWFDKNKFDWTCSYALAEYCHDKFDLWFDKDRFDWNCSYALARYCPDKFDVWFDKDKFNWRYSSYLEDYCQKHKDKWGNT